MTQCESYPEPIGGNPGYVSSAVNAKPADQIPLEVLAARQHTNLVTFVEYDTLWGSAI